MQYAKFPMLYVNVTQVPNNNFSHKGSMSAWDNAGKDTGIDNAFAPFDAEIVWKDTGSAKTGILISNTVDVKCADGTVRKPYSIHTLFWHDNDISDLYVGKQIKQGEVFYQEGTAGHATGNHIHFNVGVGNYKKGTYPLVKNEFGVWEIKGEINPTKIFFIDDNHKIIKTNGMKWVKYVEEVKPIEEVKPVEVVKPQDTELKVGDKIWIKQTATTYSTGVKIPSAYKKNGARHTKPFTIEYDGDKSVYKKNNKHWLIKEIKSYVKKSEVEKA